MYEIYYIKEIVDKYIYLTNSSLYADKLIKFEQLVEKNPYNNEMCRRISNKTGIPEDDVEKELMNIIMVDLLIEKISCKQYEEKWIDRAKGILYAQIDEYIDSKFIIIEN